MRVAVVGLGKIGLPLAAQFAESGHTVVGVDINQLTVDLVNEGIEPFPGEARLGEYLSRSVPIGRLSATSSYAEAIPQCDVIVVVVPLFVSKAGKPDFGWLDSATQSIAEHLTQQSLVLYETTLPVGTTRNRWKPLLESGSGLTEGLDFHVAFSPERVLTGRVFDDLRKYPKLVGGLSPAGAERACAFYLSALQFDHRADLTRGNGVWDLGSAEAAELAKLAETTYRDVNIGLANQFANFAERSGIDVFQVIEAANSQPFSHLHQPGIAVGGHCIPVYPHLYLSGDPDAGIVRTARAVNDGRPKHAVTLLERLHGSLRDQHVLILGASYRSGVKETAFSGVFPLAEYLEAQGARVSVHDPLYGGAELTALGMNPYGWGEPVDALILHTDHNHYKYIQAADFPGIRSVVDGRNVLEADRWPGCRFATLGRGID